MNRSALQHALRENIVDAVELRGSLFLSEAIECLKPLGFQTGEVRGEMDYLLREQRVTARSYTTRPFSLDLQMLRMDIELRKRGLPR